MLSLPAITAVFDFLFVYGHFSKRPLHEVYDAHPFSINWHEKMRPRQLDFVFVVH